MDKINSTIQYSRPFLPDVPDTALNEFADLEFDDDHSDYVEVIRRFGQLPTD